MDAHEWNRQRERGTWKRTDGERDAEEKKAATKWHRMRMRNEIPAVRTIKTLWNRRCTEGSVGNGIIHLTAAQREEERRSRGAKSLLVWVLLLLLMLMLKKKLFQHFSFVPIVTISHSYSQLNYITAAIRNWWYAKCKCFIAVFISHRFAICAQVPACTERSE